MIWEKRSDLLSLLSWTSWRFEVQYVPTFGVIVHLKDSQQYKILRIREFRIQFVPDIRSISYGRLCFSLVQIVSITNIFGIGKNAAAAGVFFQGRIPESYKRERCRFAWPFETQRI